MVVKSGEHTLSIGVPILPFPINFSQMYLHVSSPIPTYRELKREIVIQTKSYFQKA